MSFNLFFWIYRDSKIRKLNFQVIWSYIFNFEIIRKYWISVSYQFDRSALAKIVCFCWPNLSPKWGQTEAKWTPIGGQIEDKLRPIWGQTETKLRQTKGNFPSSSQSLIQNFKFIESQSRWLLLIIFTSKSILPISVPNFLLEYPNLTTKNGTIIVTMMAFVQWDEEQKSGYDQYEENFVKLRFWSRQTKLT